MRTKTGAGLGTAAIAIALTIGVPFANGEENSNEKNPFIGTWELTSDWGKSEEKVTHIIVVNPDLTGTAGLGRYLNSRLDTLPSILDTITDKILQQLPCLHRIRLYHGHILSNFNDPTCFFQ